MWHAQPGQDLGHARGQLIADFVQMAVSGVPVGQHDVEHGFGRGHHHRVARKHAPVEQASADDRLHDFGRGTKAATG